MLVSDTLRFSFLVASAVTFFGFALWAVLRPQSFASILGYELKSSNSYSEFHAIYIGVFIGQGLLCMLAASRIGDSLLGDLCAAFLLLQPFGRAVAMLRGHRPTGVLSFLFLAELLGGIPCCWLDCITFLSGLRMETSNKTTWLLATRKLSPDLKCSIIRNASHSASRGGLTRQDKLRAAATHLHISVMPLKTAYRPF